MIAVAASGGVDSLAAIIRLRAAGCAIFALHGLFSAAAAPAGLVETCARLGILLHVADLRALFAKKVVAASHAARLRGLTPNPCALCNRHIKFGALLDAAVAMGAEKLATGHYARHKDGAPGRGADLKKDQSYFLTLTPKSALQKAIFPLAELCKEQARQIAGGAGCMHLPESQDICFDGAPRGPVQNGPILLYEGPDTPAREIGRHGGLWHYTPGQRRGLGLPWREPLYARQLRPAENALIVAPRQYALMRGCVAREINLFLEPARWPEQLFARARYNQAPAAATARFCGQRLHVIFREPLPVSAPGQVVAIYDALGNALAGAVITEIIFSG